MPDLRNPHRQHDGPAENHPHHEREKQERREVALDHDRGPGHQQAEQRGQGDPRQETFPAKLALLGAGHEAGAVLRSLCHISMVNERGGSWEGPRRGKLE